MLHATTYQIIDSIDPNICGYSKHHVLVDLKKIVIKNTYPNVSSSNFSRVYCLFCILFILQKSIEYLLPIPCLYHVYIIHITLAHLPWAFLLTLLSRYNFVLVNNVWSLSFRPETVDSYRKLPINRGHCLVSSR